MLALLASVSGAGLAWGQDAPKAEDESLLEELVVSGRVRNEIQVGSFRGSNVLEAPLTVAVLPRDLMDAQLVTNLGDVLKNTPGVSFSQVSPAVSTNVTIRGIPVENRTNYRLNGGLPVVNLIDMPTEAYERVEVLKGVSSLYYGFTTPAGIVNLIAKRPLHEAAYTLNVFGNSGGGYGAHLDASGVSESGGVGVRVNLVAANADYGVDRSNGSRWAGVVALDLKPAEDMNLRFDAQVIHKDITEPAIFQMTAVGGVITLPPLLDHSKNLAPEWAKTDADEYNVMAHFDWRFARDWEFVAEAGYSDVTCDRNLSLLRNVNNTTGAAQLRVSQSNGLNFENRNYRAEVAGGFETLMLRHQLTLGVTLNERYARSVLVVNRDFAYNIFTRPFIPEVLLPARQVPNPGKITDRGYYVFDKISYEKLVDVLVGVRRTNYKNISRTGAPYRAEVTSLSGGVVVKPMTGLSFYATYIEGLEEGGVAPQTTVNPGEILQPNESKQKEVGVKWEPHRGLLLTAGYFRINRASVFTNSANRFVQDGRSIYKGVELSASGEINDYVSVVLSGSRLDAELTKGSPSLVGKVPENTAKWTGSAFVEVKIPGVEGLSVNGGAFYTSKRAVNADNQAFIPGYTLYSLGARYRTEIHDQPVEFRISAENLTNKRYFAATGGSLVAYGLPRLVKASIGVSF
jgi:iron complex outermembrane receptor protein